MQQTLTPPAHNLTTAYQAVALYYEGADSLEYIRADVPAIYRRVDGFLTLIFDMSQREELIGFQLKGFKNFYLQDEVRTKLGDDFLSLVGLLERAVTLAADDMFDARKDAYERARRLALEDKVELHDLPKVANS